ncbi:transcriptional regulator with XRE-family HTH domain [Streptomyces griseochromogenes]|uniref:Transcriptional regulator n=1 Tax=Streptomyces griseochromogenes TaxID=68214 RepID=A0A1B1ATY8_9ACTN|nr:helix-turn-helix transcriptional regulator [Streptomyces griseochromogenes]ANP50033.1 transcriptional regulator [Streptomyces griseochromogenes]MBP2048358.1 transcriptional regulator with XRE-family HTH domain [Streptomyces griseochromogenes]
MTRDNELGDFLRARRDLVSPVDAGLPWHTSRRVPGLRREEVALLAGVSTDYYTRLEQGRERHPSEQVLEAVARALRLDGDATGYLFRLAQPAPRTAVTDPARTVSPELTRLMNHFLDLPACVVSPALDILAANPAGQQLYSGFDRMDNLLRMVFLDPAARRFYRDWDHAAQGVVGNLRALSAPFPNDPRVAQVVGEVSLHSPAFAALWARYEVRPRTSEDKHLWHPLVGGMRLHYEAFTVTSAPGQQLFVYSAEPGTPSADALVLLRSLAGDTLAEHSAPGVESRTAR